MRNFKPCFKILSVVVPFALMSLSIAKAVDFGDGVVATQDFKSVSSSAVTNQSRGEWNGFKGYRHHRSGYKKHTDGWWYPEAAFQPGVSADNGNAKPKKTTHKQQKDDEKPWLIKPHVDYCAAKYKSYKRSDNSYQPLEGSRKQCLSRYYKGKALSVDRRQ